jgi:hypothetical protein
VHPQLSLVVADLESAAERLRLLDACLPYHAWNARPSPGRWSAAECVAHLNLTSEALLPLVRNALRDARDRHEPAPARYRRNALGWLASKIVAPEGGLKTRTIAAFVPTPAPPVKDMVADFLRLQREIISCVREADGLPLERVTVRSPFHGRMAYNLYAALTLVPRHQHRHLHQAEHAAQAHAPLAMTVAV